MWMLFSLGKDKWVTSAPGQSKWTVSQGPLAVEILGREMLDVLSPEFIEWSPKKS